MEHQSIITQIDKEISRLELVRRLLTQGSTKDGKPGRATAKSAKKRAKRVLSPAARARIAAAQRKRWAAAKRAAK